MRWKWLVARRVFRTVPRSGRMRDFYGLASLGGDHSEPSRYLQACAIAVGGRCSIDMNGDIKCSMKYPDPLIVASSHALQARTAI